MKYQIPIIGLITIAILISSISTVSADFSDNNDYNCWGKNMGSMMYGNYGYGGLVFSWLISILVIVALVLLIIWLIKQLQSPKTKRKR